MSDIDLLTESAFIDDLDTIVRCFDKTTKLRFRSKNDPQFIKFGSTRDNEPETNIRYGQLKLSGCVDYVLILALAFNIDDDLLQGRCGAVL